MGVGWVEIIKWKISGVYNIMLPIAAAPNIWLWGTGSMEGSFSTDWGAMLSCMARILHMHGWGWGSLFYKEENSLVPFS